MMVTCLVHKALWKTTAKFTHRQLWRMHRRAQQHWCLKHMFKAWKAFHVGCVAKLWPHEKDDAQECIKASMIMVAEMQQAQASKMKHKAAYLRVAATYMQWSR